MFMIPLFPSVLADACPPLAGTCQAEPDPASPETIDLARYAYGKRWRAGPMLTPQKKLIPYNLFLAYSLVLYPGHNCGSRIVAPASALTD